MTAEAVYLRLRATDPSRWRALAAAWRQWATLAGRLAAELPPLLGRFAAAWTGTAARAATDRLARLRRGLIVFRLLCWQADQAISEFAAALDRARALLSRASVAAARGGLTIADDGSVRGGPSEAVTPDLTAALSVADRADTTAAARLGFEPARAPGNARPSCAATAAEVRRWWSGLTPGEQSWLLATEPGWLAPLDGIPAADRDAANRLLLDDRRAEVSLAAHGPEASRLRDLRHGLDTLADRLASDDGPRAYLLRLDTTGEGRVVVALGDPDHADNVVTQVPGMTSDLASFNGELTRASRVAARATEVRPAASTSAVLWLDYDAPDFVDEAASARPAATAAPALNRFQDGLRTTHQSGADHQSVVGHSYGSLVVGKAAASDPGPAVDDVVFVGSPGVGVDSAAQLHVPPGHVWSSTSRSDVIQYAAVSQHGLADELTRAGFGVITPERHLWFGENPSDPHFGARVFTSRPDGGHLGYWDEGSQSLDALAAITLGQAP
ncbi:MAG TPA: alpha/beta hydrolase [Actinoplanes sp.]